MLLNNEQTAAFSPKSFGLIVLAFALSIFFVRFDGYIVNLAMPTFVEYFDVSIGQASWISVSYVLSQVSAIMLFGKLCGRLSIKKVFVYGLAVFTASSLLCGTSSNFPYLIISRCIQGLGGSMMLVSAYAAMVAYLPREHIGWGLGIMTVSAALGVLLGPVAGGFLIKYLDWRWVFLINLPLGILGILFSQKVIPNLAGSKIFTFKDIDFIGLIYSGVALFLLIYSLSIAHEDGLFSPVVLGCISFSVLFFFAFYVEEKRSRNPLIDIKLFNNREFALVIVSTIVGFFLFFGGGFLVPFYLTQKGLDTKEIGLLLTVFSFVYMPIGLYSGRLSDKIDPRKIVCWAMLLAAITGFIFSGTLIRQGIQASVIYLIMLAVSYGLFFSPINYYIMSFSDEDTKGSVSALYNVSLNISMALGIVLLESVYSSFKIPLDGFKAAFFAAGFCCLISLAILIFLNKARRAA